MRQRFLIGAALIVLACVPHWRTLLLSQLPLPEGYLALIAPDLNSQLRPTAWNALWWDGIGQFWAWRMEAMRQLDRGRLPLWTNRIGCGFPFLANPQTQSLYPPALVAHGVWMKFQGVSPSWVAELLAWLNFGHTLLALMGAYLLIRSFGISRLSSLVGAAAFGLGSFQTSWLLLPTLPATAAWLPLSLWCLRKLAYALDSADGSSAIRWSIGFAVSLAMLLLAGHGQIALYALLAIAIFAVLEFSQREQLWRFAAAFCAGIALAFLMAATQLLPTTELTPLTHRHAPPTWDGYRAFAQRGLTLLDWVTMALPFLFGNPMDGSYFGKESFADYCAYAGLGIFAFALLGFLQFATTTFPTRHLQHPSQHGSPSHRLVIGHWSFSFLTLHALALFLLGILLASGSSLNLPLYFAVPGFSQLGTPSRAVFLCQLALGMMAAVAMDERRRVAGSEWRIAPAVMLVPVMAVAGTGWWLSRQSLAFDWRSWLAVVATQNTGVLAGIAAISLLAFRPSGLPLLRYGMAVLLLAELSWFAAQQLPTARLKMVHRALQLAEQRLQQSVKPVPRPSPCSSVPIGVCCGCLKQSCRPTACCYFGAILPMSATTTVCFCATTKPSWRCSAEATLARPKTAT